ncbi:MAG: hypothetical protein WBD51_17420 [Burkholderiaceae bacterium]
MTGEEVAFWMMMGFSCLTGIFIGYLIFSPSKRRAHMNDAFVDDLPVSHHDVLAPETEPPPDPWLADKETLRQQARERAKARMVQSQKPMTPPTTPSVQAEFVPDTSEPKISEPDPATVPRDAGASDQSQPYFAPETLEAWDQVGKTAGRRKPGTWVKAEPSDKMTG